MNEDQFFEVEVYSPVGVRTVKAIGIGNVKESYSRDNSGSFQAVLTLAGEVIFNCADYDYFLELSQSDRRYDDVRVVVSTFCGGTKSVKWNAYIDIRKGAFNHDRQEFKCSLFVDNTNRTFESRKSDIFNILSLVSSRVETTPQYLAQVVYKNGVPLFTALLSMFRATLEIVTIKSDFFNWNSTNPAYIFGHNQKLQAQAIFQKSDIVRAGIPGYAPATVLNTSLEETIENLCSLYNLRYTLDAVGNFRIEHISWFARGTGLDLTLPKYADHIKSSRVYSYDSLKIYRVETFKNEGSINLDFVGLPIEYENALTENLTGDDNYQAPDGSRSATSDTLERSVSWFTDLDAIYGNIGDLDAMEPDGTGDLDGIVLLALAASGNIESMPGLLDINVSTGTLRARLNNVNAWAMLHESFWTYDRIFPEGKMNGTDHAFDTAQRIKMRKTITVPLCCDDVLNVEDYVNTEDGLALIKKAVANPYRGTVDLDLAYEDDGSIILGAPVANPDVYVTGISTILNTSTAGKPSVLANDIGAVDVIPQTKATAIGGSVVISLNGHFIYTPPPGIAATDQFDYFATNGAGRLDVGKVKILINTAGVYVHMIMQTHATPITSGPGTPQVAWYHWYTIIMQYFEDPFLISPIDVTGLGLVIPYSWDISLFGGSPFISGSGTLNPASGTSEVLNSGGYTQTAAGGSPPPNVPTLTATITPSPDYNVV